MSNERQTWRRRDEGEAEERITEKKSVEIRACV